MISNSIYDTIFPSDYLPMYPGSWWDYGSGWIDSCYAWETVSVVKRNTSGPCDVFYEDEIILPRSLIHKYVSNQSLLKLHPNQQASDYIPLFDTNLGVIYDSTWRGDGSKESRTVTVLELLDSLVVGNNVYYDIIHTLDVQETYYYHWGGGPTYEYEHYYAKNVGRIRSIVQNVNYDLINYHIEPY
ncbi:MAG: hypothetical protein JKY09_01950 [Crocinitomicaceae bacterium]|nr:hypothetical protein [Crocinitomicaceae bacterium]